MTQPAQILHAFGLACSVYCFLLDSLVKYSQMRVLNQHEQLIRQALIQRVEDVLPQNIGVDLNQIGSLNVSCVLDAISAFARI